jgi:mRNA-degrading endonuclease toxin of MazEF toxin-antitoxin module
MADARRDELGAVPLFTRRWMKQGDIYWVEFPGGAGRAQAGRRPAIVAQSDSATINLPTVLLIPLTSQLDALRFPGTVLIERDATNGLRQHSVGGRV